MWWSSSLVKQSALVHMTWIDILNGLGNSIKAYYKSWLNDFDTIALVL